jgi:hypothetical protein
MFLKVVIGLKVLYQTIENGEIKAYNEESVGGIAVNFIV